MAVDFWCTPCKLGWRRCPMDIQDLTRWDLWWGECECLYNTKNFWNNVYHEFLVFKLSKNLVCVLKQPDAINKFSYFFTYGHFLSSPPPYKVTSREIAPFWCVVKKSKSICDFGKQCNFHRKRGFLYNEVRWQCSESTSWHHSVEGLVVSERAIKEERVIKFKR